MPNQTEFIDNFLERKENKNCIFPHIIKGNYKKVDTYLNNLFFLLREGTFNILFKTNLFLLRFIKIFKNINIKFEENWY